MTNQSAVTATGAVVMIPLNKLKKAPENVRKAAPTPEGLAELRASIEVEGILHNLVVRPERKDDGTETGFYLVTAGERRRLVQVARAKDKQIKKDHAILCVIKEKADPVALSLAENIIREAMHPADQFEAFRTMAEERGLGIEDIAARFGVTTHVVRQRLRLGAVSPKLLDAYRENDLTLDQLTAFAITEDYDRQETVFERLRGQFFQPHTVRRLLTEGHVVASDRRALFVGADTYLAAGGFILRDLFTEDGGGYFQDVPLLDRLAIEKLAALTTDLQYAEGWKWAQSALDFPHAHGMRRVYRKPVPLSEQDQVALQTARAALSALTTEYDGYDELPDDIDQRCGGLEAEIEALEAKTDVYDPEDVARGGMLVSLSHDGRPRIERGFIRLEDLMPETPQTAADDGAGENADSEESDTPDADATGTDEDEEPERPISEYLIRDLTAHRTQALRLALGEQPQWAYLALVHALALQTLHRTSGTPLEIRPSTTWIDNYGDGLGNTAEAEALAKRHEAWAEQLPGDGVALWDRLCEMDADSLAALLAHCVAMTVNAVRNPHSFQTALWPVVDRIASAIGLDMADHWLSTVSGYFGRVTKSHIVDAVRDAKGDEVAARLDGLKKSVMAEEAERLLIGSRWLPSILRTVPPQADASDELESKLGDEAAAQVVADAAE